MLRSVTEGEAEAVPSLASSPLFLDVPLRDAKLSFLLASSCIDVSQCINAPLRAVIRVNKPFSKQAQLPFVLRRSNFLPEYRLVCEAVFEDLSWHYPRYLERPIVGNRLHSITAFTRAATQLRNVLEPMTADNTSLKKLTGR